MLAKFGLLCLLMATLAVLHGAGLGLVAQTSGDTPPEDPQAHVPALMHAGHGSATDCVQCHGSHPEPAAGDATRIVAPVPQLCVACHEEYASLGGWVHGPVATGNCLLCHDPHLSKYESLLKQSVPALCHECHSTETLGSIEGHAGESHAHCGDCHESHAGTNRILLKQKFLDSEAGARYREEAARRRRPYAFIDQRNSLAGLKGVRVIPAIERQDVLCRYGLTPESVKTEVERRLRAKGFKILSEGDHAGGQSGLYVCLRLVELRFPGYSSEVCALSGTLALSFRQTVELVRQPDSSERRLCLATTWDTGAVVVWGLPKVREGLRDGLEVLVEKFASDYLLANPSEEQPVPKR